MPENPKSLKITVLLEHHKNEENWTASVPLMRGCIAEGTTPENAQDNIIPVINYFIQDDPDRLLDLIEQPEFLITEVTIPIPVPNTSIENKQSPIQ